MLGALRMEADRLFQTCGAVLENQRDKVLVRDVTLTSWSCIIEWSKRDGMYGFNSDSTERRTV